MNSVGSIVADYVFVTDKKVSACSLIMDPEFMRSKVPAKFVTKENSSEKLKTTLSLISNPILTLTTQLRTPLVLDTTITGDD